MSAIAALTEIRVSIQRASESKSVKDKGDEGEPPKDFVIYVRNKTTSIKWGVYRNQSEFQTFFKYLIKVAKKYSRESELDLVARLQDELGEPTTEAEEEQDLVQVDGTVPSGDWITRWFRGVVETIVDWLAHMTTIHNHDKAEESLERVFNKFLKLSKGTSSKILKKTTTRRSGSRSGPTSPGAGEKDARHKKGRRRGTGGGHDSGSGSCSDTEKALQQHFNSLHGNEDEHLPGHKAPSSPVDASDSRSSRTSKHESNENDSRPRSGSNSTPRSKLFRAPSSQTSLTPQLTTSTSSVSSKSSSSRRSGNSKSSSSRHPRKLRSKEGLNSRQLAERELGKAKLKSGDREILLTYVDRLIHKALMKQPGCYQVIPDSNTLVLDGEQFLDEIAEMYPEIARQMKRLFYSRSKNHWRVPPRLNKYVQKKWNCFLKGDSDEMNEEDSDQELSSDEDQSGSDEDDSEAFWEKHGLTRRNLTKGAGTFSENQIDVLEQMAANGQVGKDQMFSLRRQVGVERQLEVNAELAQVDDEEEEARKNEQEDEEKQKERHRKKERQLEKRREQEREQDRSQEMKSKMVERHKEQEMQRELEREHEKELEREHERELEREHERERERVQEMKSKMERHKGQERQRELEREHERELEREHERELERAHERERVQEMKSKMERHKEQERQRDIKREQERDQERELERKLEKQRAQERQERQKAQRERERKRELERQREEERKIEQERAEEDRKIEQERAEEEKFDAYGSFGSETGSEKEFHEQEDDVEEQTETKGSLENGISAAAEVASKTVLASKKKMFSSMQSIKQKSIGMKSIGMKGMGGMKSMGMKGMGKLRRKNSGKPS